jgi:hypothetical protein
MRAHLGRRVRLVFERSDPVSAAEERIPIAVTPSHDLDFVAYGEDCLLAGRLRMAADRLTDMLNDHDEYQLVDVLVERLADGRSVEARDVVVTREDLLLVNATGPRGNQERRHRTRPHGVAIKLGPYHVRGYLHAAHGTDPVAAIRRRRPMVPLTDAWLDYESGGTHQRHHVGTVVVNRDLMDWIVPAPVDEVELPEAPPDLPIPTKSGPLLKDFTGALFDRST